MKCLVLKITFLDVVGAQFMARTMAMAVAIMAILACWHNVHNCQDAVRCLLVITEGDPVTHAFESAIM